MTEWVFAALTAVLVVLTALPLLRTEVWWVRGLDFPRLLLVFASLLLLAAHLVVGSPERAWTIGVTVANGLCLLYQAWWIWPYTRLKRREVADADDRDLGRITILASNVLMTNRNADALLDLVRREDPDILIAVETDAWWQERLDVLAADYPNTLRCPLDNLYGMNVYSRLPLDDGEIRFLVEDDIPSAHAHVRMANGQRFALHCVHPRPPSPSEADTSIERDAELVVVGRACAKSELPVIVAGDLNDVAWSRTTRLFRKVSGLLDPRVGRGMFNTFHAKIPFLRWPLDHLFHSSHFTLVDIRRLPGIGSDHFPIVVTLALDPGENDPDAGLERDAGAREEAHDVLAKAGVQADVAPV